MLKIENDGFDTNVDNFEQFFSTLSHTHPPLCAEL